MDIGRPAVRCSTIFHLTIDITEAIFDGVDELFESVLRHLELDDEGRGSASIVDREGIPRCDDYHGDPESLGRDCFTRIMALRWPDGTTLSSNSRCPYRRDQFDLKTLAERYLLTGSSPNTEDNPNWNLGRTFIQQDRFSG